MVSQKVSHWDQDMFISNMSLYSRSILNLFFFLMPYHIRGLQKCVSDFSTVSPLCVPWQIQQRLLPLVPRCLAFLDFIQPASKSSCFSSVMSLFSTTPLSFFTSKLHEVMPIICAVLLLFFPKTHP